MTCAGTLHRLVRPKINFGRCAACRSQATRATKCLHDARAGFSIAPQTGSSSCMRNLFRVVFVLYPPRAGPWLLYALSVAGALVNLWLLARFAGWLPPRMTTRRHGR